MRTIQNGQTHSINSSANCQRIVWVGLIILWSWSLKNSFWMHSASYFWWYLVKLFPVHVAIYLNGLQYSAAYKMFLKTFLPHWYAHVRVRIRNGKMLVYMLENAEKDLNKMTEMNRNMDARYVNFWNFAFVGAIRLNYIISLKRFSKNTSQCSLLQCLNILHKIVFFFII